MSNVESGTRAEGERVCSLCWCPRGYRPQFLDLKEQTFFSFADACLLYLQGASRETLRGKHCQCLPGNAQ